MLIGYKFFILKKTKPFQKGIEIFSREEIKMYISLPPFKPMLQIYRVSVAAAPMAAWVKANVQFSVVLEKVKPLEDDLAGLQASLDASRARVKQCENDLASLDGTVSRLKEEFARRTGEAEALKIGLQQVRRKNESLYRDVEC